MSFEISNLNNNLNIRFFPEFIKAGSIPTGQTITLTKNDCLILHFTNCKLNHFIIEQIIYKMEYVSIAPGLVLQVKDPSGELIDSIKINEVSEETEKYIDIDLTKFFRKNTIIKWIIFFHILKTIGRHTCVRHGISFCTPAFHLGIRRSTRNASRSQ